MQGAHTNQQLQTFTLAVIFIRRNFLRFFKVVTTVLHDNSSVNVRATLDPANCTWSTSSCNDHPLIDQHALTPHKPSTLKRRRRPAVGPRCPPLSSRDGMVMCSKTMRHSATSGDRCKSFYKSCPGFECPLLFLDKASSNSTSNPRII